MLLAVPLQTAGPTELTESSPTASRPRLRIWRFLLIVLVVVIPLAISPLAGLYLFLLDALLLLGVVVSLFLMRRSLRFFTLIHQTPTSKISDIHSGFVEVSGRVVARGKALVTPITHRPCVYYVYLREFLKTCEVSDSRGTRTETWWEPIRDIAENGDWAIEDGTGSVQIALDEADLMLSPAKTLRAVETIAPDPLITQTHPKQRRHTETVIQEGDELYVLGTVKRRLSGELILCRGDDFLVVTDGGEGRVLRRYGLKSLMTPFVLILLSYVVTLVALCCPLPLLS
jgi:hypothetical protein